MCVCVCVCVCQGDGSIFSIAAASIIAKVTRDRIMHRYDEQYPEYGFAKHKGYPTAEHVAKLHKFGVTPIHRRSFGPVKRLCGPGTAEIDKKKKKAGKLKT